MLPGQVKKNKVDLKNYPYLKDIENRILMGGLTTFEVDLLSEILNNSLKIPVKFLANTFNKTEGELLTFLTKLSQTKLLSIHGGTITVDKEMRKYYEFQIRKFDESFVPDMEYLQALLNKVPIHILPEWYALPKTSDNIFEAILEKIFQTPKIYEKYLSEIVFDDPILPKIMQDVFQANDYKISAKFLAVKYSLTKEKLEEYLLLLEFHLVCCLSYELVDDRWEEVVTPYHEWRQFLRFQEKTHPQSIEISDVSPRPFHFIEMLSEALKTPKTASKEVLDKAVQLGLLETFSLTEKGADWLSLKMPDRAMLLYREPFALKLDPKIYHDRGAREVERALKPLIKRGWIRLGDFMKSLTCTIGKSEAVVLGKKGKSWRYLLPIYSEDETAFVRMMIFERLYHSGIVDIHGECFSVTPFGCMTLGD